MRELLGGGSYSFPNVTLQIFGVPPFVPIGWVFTWYLGYEFTRRILPPGKGLIAVAAIFSAFICIPVETMAMDCEWWVLEGWIITDAVAPEALIWGWNMTAIFFFYMFAVVHKEVPLKHLIVLVFVGLCQYSTFLFGVLILPLFIGVLGALFILIALFNRAIAVVQITYALVHIINTLTTSFITNAVFVAIDMTVALIVIAIQVMSSNRAKIAQDIKKSKSYQDVIRNHNL